MLAYRGIVVLLACGLAIGCGGGKTSGGSGGSAANADAAPRGTGGRGGGSGGVSGGSGTGGDRVVATCIPGITQACVGRGACAGGQSCSDNGAGWLPCDCGPGGGGTDGGAVDIGPGTGGASPAGTGGAVAGGAGGAVAGSGGAVAGSGGAVGSGGTTGSGGAVGSGGTTGSGGAPGSGGTGQICTPGVTQGCTGPGACAGGQMCLPEGSGWATCDCGGSGSGGGSGQICVPGVTQGCIGPGACFGGQSCRPDGMGWQTCQCGGTGGASGTGGTAGTGGSVGTGGSGTGGGPCPASITDGETTCSQPGLLCQKPCGVESKGTKTCGCVGGVFDCGNAAFGGCHYLPNQDLTCYQLPSSVPACPAETQHNTACSGAACQPCSGYLDSGRNPKVGYCVCAALDSGGLWKCATNLEWPPRVPVSGAGCNTLGFLGPAVTATCQPGSPAEPAGGDIANGTYVATSLGVYGLGIDCFPSDWGTFATTWAFSAGTYQYLSSDTNIMSRRNATFTTVGSTLNITYNCPNSNTGATLYSATPTTFTTFTPGSLSDGSEFTLVETYARIGP